MDQNEFGAKVRQMREELELTREEFCEDEVELTVRQLTRIEAGVSKPTLTKMQFIADRLGITLFQLMPDYFELPVEYRRLKYDVIRVPTYKKQEAIDVRDDNINQMYDSFYDQLPKDERLVPDLLRSIFDVRDEQSDLYGRELLEEHFEKSYHKEVYTVTDLLIIRLFVEQFRVQSLEDNQKNLEIFTTLSKKVIKQSNMIPSDELFVLRDLIFAMIGAAGDKELHEDISELISCLEKIMHQTQDFQKMPILKLVTWKYHLFVNEEYEQARKEYEQALMFAEMLKDNYLLEKLQWEWQEDTKL